MSPSQTLNCRCGISSFKEHAKPILDVTNERSKNCLRESGILQFFEIPDLKQNISLLTILVKAYSRKHKDFLIGNVYVKFTANQIALMLGLPNRGVEFKFERRPFAAYEQKDLLLDMERLSKADWSEDIEKSRVDILVKYLLSKLLFPLQVLKIPQCIHIFCGVEEFQRYNWPSTVHKFMHS
ncbi:hypothetical protein KSP40_PGU022293 [Platanthera guangdongensis]|uniref:DUF1985 domain-containing protein n=1 Tax=Platanthera guangdongensis TaxID=2320717 RepID=A0ABR2LKU7_9ASPA